MLEDGDIVSIDCGAIIEGWHADAAITVPVGEVDAESQRLMDVTRAALESAIAATVAGNRLGDIGAAAEREATTAGFGVVREYVGHGIGTAMHEEPEVPNYGPAGRGCGSGPGSCSPSSRWSPRAGPPPAPSTTAGPWSPPTAPAPPISSTPSRSPTTAPEGPVLMGRSQSLRRGPGHCWRPISCGPRWVLA